MYSRVYICINVCIYSIVLLLIACIIGLFWLCITVSCELELEVNLIESQGSDSSIL